MFSWFTSWMRDAVWEIGDVMVTALVCSARSRKDEEEVENEEDRKQIINPFKIGGRGDVGRVKQENPVNIGDRAK